MQVDLAFGETGLTVDLPAHTDVVVPRHAPAAADELAEIRRALRSPVAGPPLRARVKAGQTVAISICDQTRPQPRKLVLRELLEELDGVVRSEDVIVLIATGTHSGGSDAANRQMLGDEIFDAVRVVNHDARVPDSLRWVGKLGDGVPVWLNRAWLDADVRITTGVVEPHFFAGFSGGPKMVAPGLAGLDTVLVLHDAKRIGDPRSTWGPIVGNPIQNDVRAIAAATGVTFALDVVIDRNQHVARAFGGDLAQMHAAAIEFSQQATMQPVTKRYDVVVTTGSGYPLDQNLYQAVKGMSAGNQIVQAGGTIVCAAECRNGFPDHGEYRRLLEAASSPRGLLDEIASRENTVPDQWQAQIQARIQEHARVVMHTRYLSDENLEAALLEQSASVESAVAEALTRAGPGATICVLPEGPRTVPYVAHEVLA